MRLFVAVVPPDEVLDQVEDVLTALKERVHAQAPPPGQTSCSEQSERAPGDVTPLRHGHIRWQTRPQWHVTLRFIGEAEDPAPFTGAMEEAVASAGPATARLGPEVTLLGRHVVCAPATGLDTLATRMDAAVAALGRPPERRPFRGHLTLARLPQRKPPPSDWFTGVPLDASWTITEVALVRSHSGGSGPARYETLTTALLT
jgi:RNA 2',3'-cyclic 3'-phosphodiesterase